ncbi:NADPH-dependent F420 reductase [Tateyamaria armeniaca]|uniref:NADPH-dependent F420 reductase n=1 Tax=Tateyamaria armeniaca TaxID=2518930 RepID=A0ABW8UMY6_9RHOB
MKIAFLGYGNMADALASKWSRKHDVFFGGRSAEKAAALAAKHGGGSGSAAEAAAFGDVIILATHNTAVFDIIEQAGGAAAFTGKVVVDINNPISTETFLTTRTDGRSLTEAIADALPGAHVSKAFNMSQARVWSREDMTWDGRPLVVGFTADDGAAEVTATLVSDTGAQPLLLGGNEFAYQLEAIAAVVIKQLFSGADAMTVMNLINPADKPI